MPDQLQWSAAGELCDRRSGVLVTASSTVEKEELSSFLKSLNISQPVWIARKVTTHDTSRCSRLFFTLDVKLLTLLSSKLMIA